ncbi:hypothetical protein BR93DRAFT_977797 [Coniochaeta sp. PMI_546]|nr:hypothetical protein BR93DRAFT_977797 [Coniochaeta sp. PMI_546]
MDTGPPGGGQAATDDEGHSLTDCLERARRYALALSDRVKSLDVDPLHSAAYLTYLAKYLKVPFQKAPKRQHLFNIPSTARRPFVIQYLLRPGKSPDTNSFDDPYGFTASAASPSQNEILFLTGRPSADWLNCLGSKYSLDYRFFHQHLGPIISGNRQQWSAGPDLPSRSLQVLTMQIPTIVFVGSRGRNLDIRGLEIAREKCNAQLRRAFLSLQDSAASEAGRSIIRRLEVHDGGTLVVEQQMTATIVHRGNFWTIFIWSDAGNEVDHAHIPVPPTEDFASVASDLVFCPVFFDNQSTGASHPVTLPDRGIHPHSMQPLVLLNTRYGFTIDWSTCSTDSPLAVLKELFMFNAAAALQYVNMLDHVLLEIGGRSDFPSYEHTKLETTVQYDYIKASLSRFEQHCSDVLAFLRDPPVKWKLGESHSSVDSAAISDFDYLTSRARSLLKVCEDGKATLMSNDSVQAAKRSAREAKLVTQLTKTTNRLTFIFLPISYITSVFGMNFEQFGQGSMSIWVWAVTTIPLLIICVLIVERGEWMKSKWRQYRGSDGTARL